MSRCFPFPPPGYEKKARTDDPDLLKKEKQREKKHRKEKKDKEKRESKEKKDKDGSDEKHREKKDKKEKHREKKKDKDRDKDKEKNTGSDEKRLPGKSEGHDAEKTPNQKKLPGKSESHNGGKFVPKEKDKDRNSNSGEKKVPMQFSGYSREYNQNSYLPGNAKDSKIVQEFGRRVGDEHRGIESHMVDKFAGTDRRRDEGMVKSVARSTGSLDEGKEKTRDERSVGDEARFSGNDMFRKLTVQSKVQGMPRPLEKDSESRSEGKQRTKQTEGDDKHGDKSKYNNKEKNEQGKDEEKKKEKAKMKSDHKNIEKDKLKQINMDDHIATHNTKALQLPKDGNKNAISEGNLRKRKELETNGYCHVNDIKPSKLQKRTASSHSITVGNKLAEPASMSDSLTEINKLPRPTSSSHSLPGNGRILDPFQTAAPFASDKGGAAHNFKADKKERKLNGVIVSQPLSVNTARPQVTGVQTDQIAEVPVKPPHPDTKYLSQVLLVPEMEDCSNFDDQEWLFQSSDSHSETPKLGYSGNDEKPQVWAEAMRIESADVCALPYVIPY